MNATRSTSKSLELPRCRISSRTDGSAKRREAGDTFAVTFSEAIASPVGPGGAITQTDPIGAGNDRLTIAGLTAVAGLATGSNLYILADNTSATFSSSTVNATGAVVTATVAGACSGTCGANIAAGVGALVFTPDPALQDAPATPRRAASPRHPSSSCSDAGARRARGMRGK